MVITMAKLRMVHASTHGARKPPGAKEERLNDGKNNGQATHGARKHAWRMPSGPKKSSDSFFNYYYFQQTKIKR